MPRLEAVAEALASQIVEHESELRGQLRLSLQQDGGERRELPFGTGRAIVWIEEALAPLRGRMRGPGLDRFVLR